MLKGDVAYPSYDTLLSNLSQLLFCLKICFSSKILNHIIISFLVIFVIVNFHKQNHKFCINNQFSNASNGVEIIEEILFPPLLPPLCNTSPDKRKDAPSLNTSEAAPTLLKDSIHNCHHQSQNAHGIYTANARKKDKAPQLPKSSQETSSSVMNNHKGSQQTCEYENSSYFQEAKVIRNGSLLLDHLAGKNPSTGKVTPDQKPTQSRMIKKTEKKSKGRWKLFQKHTKVSPEITHSCDEKNDTMESIWDAIKAEKPEVNNLNKRETFAQSSKYKEQIYSESSQSKADGTSVKRLKSITFEETLLIVFKGGLRREPYMSLEELNGKFETFIHNSKLERMLQRQESEWRYQEMMKRSL